MTHQEINTLLSRFLSAQTTEAEEQTLAEYFQSAESVPEEWQPYRELFLSFGSSDYNLTDEELQVLSAEPRPTKRKVRPLYWLGAAAAVAAILIVIGATLLYNNVREEKTVVSLQDNKNNSTGTQDYASYATAPTEHPLASQGLHYPSSPEGWPLRGGAKMAKLHQSMPSTENIALEDNEDHSPSDINHIDSSQDDSPSKIEGVDAEQTGAYDNANMAYSVTEHPEPAAQMAVYSETDLPVSNPQNLLYTDEDIQKLRALYRQALIAEAQQAIDITNYNLKQVEILLAQK